eukprot:TRINITY_DN7193_c0_g2_i1.p1 TRINITY_DN7193_c0_g2~~TRINITY_DN7193_c0_g2_i1.p1  ORF type:complete len:347 (+),score=62.74 TRINITY_DN7193_c0_g2_i1:30-1070(+)
MTIAEFRLYDSVTVLSNSSQHLLILVLHFLLLFSVVAYLAYFVYFEYRKQAGWKGLLKNKYICITVVSSCAVLSNSVVYIRYYFLHNSDYLDSDQIHDATQKEQVLLFLCTLFVAIAGLGHVMLLYLRTRAVFQSSQILNFVMRFLVVFFVVFGVITLVGSALLVIYEDYDFGKFSPRRVAFNIGSGGYAVCLSSIDLISTCYFAKYVREIAQGLKNQRLVDVTTDIIARLGFITSSTSLLGSAVFIIARFVTTNNLTEEWLYLATVVCIVGVGLLWMHMKIKLDVQPKRATKETIGTSSEVGIRNATITTTPNHLTAGSGSQGTSPLSESFLFKPPKSSITESTP